MLEVNNCCDLIGVEFSGEPLEKHSLSDALNIEAASWVQLHEHIFLIDN